jgi:hypothetical protein
LSAWREPRLGRLKTHARETLDGQLCLATLNSHLAPLPDKERLSLPVGRKHETGEQDSFHEVFARNIDFNGVVVLTKTEQNGYSRMDVTFL